MTTLTLYIKNASSFDLGFERDKIFKDVEIGLVRPAGRDLRKMMMLLLRSSSKRFLFIYVLSRILL